MLAKALLTHILDDEALTRGLGDAEARVLVEWLVERAELLAERSPRPADLTRLIQASCRRGRGGRAFRRPLVSRR